jgi:hypothetical protein
MDTLMRRRISQIPYLLALAVLFAFATASAQASDTSRLSGTYKVLHKTELGSQTRVQLQLHLANNGPRDLQVRRINLRGAPHSPGAKPQPCSLLVHPGYSASATQEFTVPRSEYRRLRLNSGAPLELLLAVDAPGGREATELIRLDRISPRKAN